MNRQRGKVHTIRLEQVAQRLENHPRCCHTMTVGSRRTYGGKGKPYPKKGKHVPCPDYAVRMIKGQPYCAHHAPSGCTPADILPLDMQEILARMELVPSHSSE
jgi:hypothetical protein